MNAARALGKIGDAAVAAEWIETLKDLNTDATTRHGAAEALGELRLPAAVPALVKTLSDESTWVGHNATKALRKIGTPEAMEAHTKRKGIRSTALIVAPFVAPSKTANNADMVLIPAGEFQMGTHDGASIERPAHTVKLSAFYIDVHLVTVAQYQTFIGVTGHRAPDWMRIEGMSPADDCPALYVNWYDAMAYAEWMGKRLPTEAEWEYAARGGLVGKTYPWGDEQPDASRANYGKQVREITPVEASPNGYDLYDMAGNVLEWRMDAFDADFYAASPAEAPLSVDDGDVVDGQFGKAKRPRVVRGGSLWSPAEGLRVTNRSHTNSRKKSNYIGFRCVAPCQRDPTLNFRQ